MTVVQGFAPPPAPSLREVAEAWGDLIDPRDAFRDEPGYGFGGIAYAMDQPNDRARGEDPPRFRTEHDLARIRGSGRFFGRCSNLGESALTRLANYTFGNGATIAAQAAIGVGDVSEDLIAAVQQVCDAFGSRNKINGSLDREIDGRCRTDGESLLALELVNGWQADIRVAEPVQLTEPSNPRSIEHYVTGSGRYDCDSAPMCWSFGVQTVEGRHDKPLGYHFVWSADGMNWDWIDENRVQHTKRNVHRNVKRGVSDFYVISDFLSKSERLLGNTAHGAAIQAAIPFVKQFVAEASNEKIDSLRTSKTTQRSVATPEGRQSVYQQHFAPGTIPFAKGWDFKDGPGGDNRIDGFLEALQACYRYLGIRWDMPEGMISGDASNNNFASALVAEAPFVKAREADQQVYVGEFRSLYWKAIRLAYDAGRFARFGLNWSELQAAIFIKVDFPKVATRDRLKDAQTNEIEKRNGVLSARTWASETGRDYDAEVDDGAKETDLAIPSLLRSNGIGGDEGTTPLPESGAVPIQDITLNGAQIQSAVTVLQGVRDGSIAPLAAVELLTSIGIPRDRASAMATATKALPAPAVPAAEPAAPKTEAVESTDDRIKRSLASWRDYP